MQKSMEDGGCVRLHLIIEVFAHDGFDLTFAIVCE